MKYQLFTVHPGVLPVTTLVFYDLDPSKGLYFPFKSCYLIYFISKILRQIAQLILGSLLNVTLKWLINISSLNTSSLSNSNSWQNCNYRLEHKASHMEMKERLCLAWLIVLAELLWWFVPVFCPGPKPALCLQRRAVSFTYIETPYVILINLFSEQFLLYGVGTVVNT